MYEVGGDIYVGRSMDTPPEDEPFIHLYGVLICKAEWDTTFIRDPLFKRTRMLVEDFTVLTIDESTARESITHAEALEWLEGCV